MHVTLAKEQRDYIGPRSMTVRTNLPIWMRTTKKSGNVPGSIETKLHYSWDYAQTVHYPHHALQTSPIYIKTPRKCHVFGMCCEASGKQNFTSSTKQKVKGKVQIQLSVLFIITSEHMDMVKKMFVCTLTIVGDKTKIMWCYGMACGE